MLIEQQCFLSFCLEAGTLDVERTVCSSLQTDQPLLVAVLAEIKALFEDFAKKNGKYERFAPAEDVDQDSYQDLEIDLMGLVPELRNDYSKASTKPVTDPVKRVRRFGDTIAPTGRRLRTIAVEPKRLIWAAVDKESFELLISKLQDLNSFLIALLDSSQRRRLQDALATNYLEIVRLRNDIVSLTALVKALASAAEDPLSSLDRKIGSNHSSLSQAAVEEAAAQNKRKKYLKQLVEIKIQSTILGHANSKSMVPTGPKPEGSRLLPSDFEFDEAPVEFDVPQERQRFGLLADLLRFVKPDGFRAPPCLGYVEISTGDNISRFGTVFEKPPSEGAQLDLITLRELLGQKPKPSLSSRISLCAVLARCVHSFHSVNWLHKALRTGNVVFFASSRPPDLSVPFVSGFEFSRPSIIDQMTEKPDFDPSKEIYRHPSAQFGQMDGRYQKSYDIYSLGVLIIEIALWAHVDTIVGLDLSKAKPRALSQVQSWLLGTSTLPPDVAGSGSCLQQVAYACGNIFRGVVKCCLEMSAVEEPEFVGEQETSIAMRLQRVTENTIVQKLEHLASIL